MQADVLGRSGKVVQPHECGWIPASIRLQVWRTDSDVSVAPVQP